MEEENKTPIYEWIGIILFIVVLAIIVYYLFYNLKPQLFSGTEFEVDGRPSNAVICPASPAPVNLTASVVDFSRPSFDASWDPVLTVTTTNDKILGYNVYVGEATGVTKTNTKIAGFTPSSQVRVTVTGNGSLEFGRIYYFKVATVSECGEGLLSDEEFAISI